MTQTFTGRKRVRKFFGKIREVAEMPNLIEVQKASYDQFLQLENPEGERNDDGLQAVFKSVFPISDFSGTAMLEFVRYEFEPPKYDVDECRQRGMTFAAPLKVTLRLIVFDVDPETQAKSVKDIKEQDVYMGDIPLMTMNGTFIVNGTERVIVSQMHRSPGVFFDHDKGKTHSSGKLLLPRASFPIAVPGSTSSSTPRTSCMRASTESARFPRRRSSMRSAWTAKRFSARSTTASCSSARRTARGACRSIRGA
jgi:DNA-directed RNA polymerase subunit beta